VHCRPGGGLARLLNAFKQKGKVSLPQRPLPANKIRQLLHFAVDDDFNKTETAKRLGIARSSATKYIKAFNSSTLTLTDLENVFMKVLGRTT
jgi:response regulator of citrate/malate metabolism